jgi:hypothetical protein
MREINSHRIKAHSYKLEFEVLVHRVVLHHAKESAYDVVHRVPATPEVQQVLVRFFPVLHHA